MFDKMLYLEMLDIKKDYIKSYYRIISCNGICRKSNEYANKIDRQEMLIAKYENLYKEEFTCINS